MAVRLAQCGAQTALLNRDEDGLQQTHAYCEQAVPRSRYYLVDITEESPVEACFRALASDFGTLDGVINNAGITQDGLLVRVKDGQVVKKMSLADWDAVSHIDMRGVFLCAREAAARMSEARADDNTSQSPGLILNVSSISRAGNIGQTNYSATKSGVDAMTVTWAKVHHGLLGGIRGGRTSGCRIGIANSVAINPG